MPERVDIARSGQSCSAALADETFRAMSRAGRGGGHSPDSFSVTESGSIARFVSVIAAYRAALPLYAGLKTVRVSIVHPDVIMRSIRQAQTGVYGDRITSVYIVEIQPA